MLGRLLVRFKRLNAEEFDPDFYLAQNPDVVGSGYAPLKHYMKYGWKEGRDPSPNFSTSFYLSSYPAAKSSGLDPLSHYLLHGKAQGWLTAAPMEPEQPPESEPIVVEQPKFELTEEEAGKYFSRDYYLAHNIDIKKAGIDPFNHYMNYGWKEHRDPSAYFCTHFYLAANIDIRNANINPLAHFVKYGIFEGRVGVSYKNSLDTKLINPKVSVVIPNYNHELFLPSRIESIIAQTYDKDRKSVV